MSVTLVDGMANLRISDHSKGSGSLPVAPRNVNGQQLNVAYMNNEQQSDLKAKIDRLCAAEQKLAAAEAKIAAGKAQQENGRAMQAQAKTNIAACDSKVVQGLDAFAIALVKKKEGQTDQIAIERIEALRVKVIAAKTNLPPTAAEQQQLITKLQKEAQELYASLKKA